MDDPSVDLVVEYDAAVREASVQCTITQRLRTAEENLVEHLVDHENGYMLCGGDQFFVIDGRLFRVTN